MSTRSRLRGSHDSRDLISLNDGRDLISHKQIFGFWSSSLMQSIVHRPATLLSDPKVLHERALAWIAAAKDATFKKFWPRDPPNSTKLPNPQLLKLNPYAAASIEKKMSDTVRVLSHLWINAALSKVSTAD